MRETGPEGHYYCDAKLSTLLVTRFFVFVNQQHAKCMRGLNCAVTALKRNTCQSPRCLREFLSDAARPAARLSRRCGVDGITWTHVVMQLRLRHPAVAWSLRL